MKNNTKFKRIKDITKNASIKVLIASLTMYFAAAGIIILIILAAMIIIAAPFVMLGSFKRDNRNQFHIIYKDAS